MLGVRVVILASPRKPPRLPQSLPVGRPITGAAKALGIDERLDQEHGMSELLLPVLRQSRARQLEHARSQVGPPPRAGQHQETAVLREKMAAFLDLASRPVQELVTWFKVQRRRTKGQHRDPFSAVFGDITQDPADRIGVTLYRQCYFLGCSTKTKQNGDWLGCNNARS